jgi:hypothetical protein
MADGGETWGKRSARTRRSARRKESMISGATWQLAGSERTVGAYLGWGKMWQKVKNFSLPAAFIARGERELKAGPSGRPLARLVPLFPGRWRVGLSQFWTGGASLEQYLRTLFMGPAHCLNFLFIPNWTEFVNYKNHHFVAPTFTKLCNMIEWKIGNKFPSVIEFKFQTEFELKILEVQLLLNLNWIYWRSKLAWKNLINYLKFLHAFIFHNMNLDWLGCMVKSSVPYMRQLDLVWN